jgi:hypothetical protein
MKFLLDSKFGFLDVFGKKFCCEFFVRSQIRSYLLRFVYKYKIE